MPAPGDVRATIATFAALSGRDAWARLWEKRLRCAGSDLDGMALGNLVLSLLFQENEDFTAAVRRASEILGLRGRVIPVTGDDAQIGAELADGTILLGESAIRRPGKPPIRRLIWDGPVPIPATGVVEAVEGAGLIVVGPGCLYTSVLPCLLVEGIAKAVASADAVRVYVCNTTSTMGQTDGFTVLRHVEEVIGALGPRALDAVLIQGRPVPKDVQDRYGALGVHPLVPAQEELEAIHRLGALPVVADLMEDPPDQPRPMHKLDCIRHDPSKLRAVLDTMLDGWDPRAIRSPLQG
jgi:uncharacterized cofD-like protein